MSIKSTITRIYFTEMKKKTSHEGRLIDVCPKCGRNGRKTTYDDFISYDHEGYIQFGMLTITDRHEIPNEVV